MLRFILTCCGRGGHWLSKVKGLGTGLLLGAMLLLWWTHALVTCSGTLVVMSGLAVAAALGAAAGWQSESRQRSPQAIGLRWMILALWTATLPVLSSGWLGIVSQLRMDWLEHPSVEFLVAFCFGIWLLALPHFGLAQVLAAAREQRPTHETGIWCGLTLALALIPAAILPLFGLALPVVVVSVSALVCGMVALAAKTSTAGSDASVAGRVEECSTNPSALLWPLCGGGLLAIAGQLRLQLWSTSLAGSFALAAGVFAGASLSRWLAGRKEIRPLLAVSSATRSGLAVAMASLILVGSFGLLVELTLWINGSITSVAAVVGWRTGLTMLLGLPAGVCWGTSLFRANGPQSRRIGAVGLLAFVGGWTLVRFGVPGPSTAAAILAAAGVLVAVRQWWLSGAMLPGTRSGWLGLGTGVACIAAAPWWLGQYDPVQSARWLHSPNAAIAAQTSSQRELLSGLDNARLVRLIAGTDAVWTLWAQRGEYRVVRENGSPVGHVSRDRAVAPESPAELLAGALPLLVHPRADQVLIVGLGSGATIRSGLETPVQTLTCWEQDADLIDLLTTDDVGSTFLDDPRFNLRRVNPTLASATRSDKQFDVIVLNSRSITGGRALGQHHVEAYARWRNLLKPGGLVCQRFEFVNIGARSLADLTSTLAAVFPQVILWESAPGELLLLASIDDRPLLDSSVLARFESPQARRLFGSIGWDYSHPLNVVTIDGAELLQHLARPADVATAANAHFEFTTPREEQRRDNKVAEVFRTLKPLSVSALSRIPTVDGHDELKKRLEDVVDQRKLITQYPDHYWAYRKTLRERLQERPRAVIQQMQHELHPEDKRRRDYLEALGAAATVETPTSEQLSAVAAFAEPFDPLVSPFLHRELALLWSRAAVRTPAVELQLWLHAVYYSPGYDRSIRDATEALRVLLDHPEAMPDPQRRWDHMNSLLEILKERWTLRSQQQAMSRFESSDVSETMEVAQRALDELNGLALKANVDPDWAQSRVRVIERTFVRALRSYHAQQIARQKELQRRQTAMEASRAAQAQ